MVGARQYVSMASGPAHSLGEWLEHRQLADEVQAERMTGMRGSSLMIRDMEDAIPADWLQPMDSQHQSGWKPSLG